MMKFGREVSAFCASHPAAAGFVHAIVAWRPEALASFKVRAPGDQFSVRIESAENPDGNCLELFHDRELGPMMIFSRWHMTANEAACPRCPDDPVPAPERIAALLAAADRLMRDELVLVIHEDGMNFRPPERAKAECLRPGDQVVSWSGRLDLNLG